MNNLSGFNTQEMRRLHPYLSALLRRLKELEVKVEAGTRIVWGTDEDILPTGNENLAGILNKFARADHQHLFKFPVAVPLATPDGSAFFDLSTSAINIYVDDTPTTRVVAGGTDSDVRATKRRDTGTAPRYAFADHSHPTAVLPKDDPQPPEIDEIRYDEDDKLVRWDGDNWVLLSVETADTEAGTDADVQPTKLRDAGSSTRYARADHSHPTALLPQSDPQPPVEGEIRYTADDKLVRWNGSEWVEVSVEEVEAGVDADVRPTRRLSAGQSPRFARADHSHPTAILPQADTQLPEADEIRYTADNKIVRWDATAGEWVPLSVETFTIEYATDTQPTRLRSAGSSTRVARADHSHPTAILPQSDTQTPVADEIRYNTEGKLVRWNGSEWVPLSVETFTIDWGDDVQATGLRSAGTSARVARADHSHPTAILPESDEQTPVAGEIRYNAEDKLVRWDEENEEWVPLSVETFEFEVEWGEDEDVQPTGLQSTGTVDRFARADHSHPTALLPEDDPQTPVEGEIRYNAEGKIVRWDGSEWVPLSVEAGGGATIEYGTDADVQPTRLRSAGSSDRVARADHSHPTALLPQSDPQTPVVDEIRYNANNKIVRWDEESEQWVPLSVETFTVDWGTNTDIQPTGARSAGSVDRFARADHSHPTAILPEDDPQTPVVDEIRYNDEDKIVRWNGTEWVPLSVEIGGGNIEYGTDADVQPTRLRSAGSSNRVARADHSHPTAILPQSDTQTPVADEIRYNTNNKLVRWDGEEWVELSVETIQAGLLSDVQKTGLRSTGTATRFARADHSHPTALLTMTHSQTAVLDELRYKGANRLVRWTGSNWTDIVGALPVPADPLVLPFDNEVSSPQHRQLVNHSAWDNIGHATVFYRDANNSQYRLIFARPLAVSITSTPSGKDVWSNTANELVLKRGAGMSAGAVLWNRTGNTTTWSPVAPHLSDDTSIVFPSDVGVLTRSPLTGASGSRRWFVRGVQEDGSFRAPFAGIATFTSATAPAHGNLATNLNDGYAYFIHDIDRVDVVRPITDGNKYCTMLSHSIIAPPCRVFRTDADPSGHYVRDELWNDIWVLAFYTTTSATTNYWATLPNIAIPYGITGGRALLYLHNPQSFQITTVFRVAVSRPTSTGVSSSSTANTTITIPANTTVVADLGYFSFAPSTTLSHHRSHIITPFVVRQKSAETTNANKVLCLGVVIVPQRSA